MAAFHASMLVFLVLFCFWMCREKWTKHLLNLHYILYTMLDTLLEHSFNSYSNPYPCISTSTLWMKG